MYRGLQKIKCSKIKILTFCELVYNDLKLLDLYLNNNKLTTNSTIMEIRDILHYYYQSLYNNKDIYPIQCLPILLNRFESLHQNCPYIRSLYSSYNWLNTITK
jgi:hypothetical protein